MAKTFDYFFDFGSLASYLAHTQLDKIQAETGASPIYLPMLLGAVFKATGNVSPVSVPAKGKYLFVDFKRFADSYGVSLNNNPFFPSSPQPSCACSLACRCVRMQECMNSWMSFTKPYGWTHSTSTTQRLSNKFYVKLTMTLRS